MLREMTAADLREVARAFTLLFWLRNLAEERHSAAIRGVSSVERSSTSSNSHDEEVCAWTLVIARASVASPFRTGINTVTVGESGIGWPAVGSGEEVLGTGRGGGGGRREPGRPQSIAGSFGDLSWTGIDRPGGRPDRSCRRILDRHRSPRTESRRGLPSIRGPASTTLACGTRPGAGHG